MKILLKSYKGMFGRKYVKIYLLYMLFFMVDGPVQDMLPVLMEEKGQPARYYGYVLALVNACCVVIPGLVSIVSVKSSAYRVAVITMLAAVATGCMAGDVNQAGLLIGVLVLLACVRTSFNYSLGNDINYEVADEHRGKYFAVRDLFLYGGISLGLFLGGQIAKVFDVSTMYRIGGVLYILPLIMLLLVRAECRTRTGQDGKTTDSDDEEKEETKTSWKSFRKIAKDKKFWTYMTVKLFSNVYAVAMGYLPLYALTIGISVSHVMSIFSFMTLFNAIGALFVSHLGDLKGRKWFYVFDIGFDVFPAMIFLLSHNVTVFIIGIILSMVKDIFASVSFAYFYDVFDDHNGTIILGIVESFSSAIGIVMPVVIGWVWECSPQLVFGIGAAGCLISAGVAAIFLPDKRPCAVTERQK
ncbi:MAG: MFS transporter [Lachnospiraceae bacterium]|nr:MFS transporter [Lachnospiraceae bacterium]